jgi:phosphoribosyl-ATP pyrophosphohydrolase
MADFTLADLENIVAGRADANAAVSYTRSLLDAGPSRIAKKFGEEAVELVIAMLEGDRPAVINEAADVLYHLLVALKASGVSLQDVLKELERRTRQSGHQEKASRGR